MTISNSIEFHRRCHLNLKFFQKLSKIKHCTRETATRYYKHKYRKNEKSEVRSESLQMNDIVREIFTTFRLNYLAAYWDIHTYIHIYIYIKHLNVARVNLRTWQTKNKSERVVSIRGPTALKLTTLRNRVSRELTAS